VKESYYNLCIPLFEEEKILMSNLYTTSMLTISRPLYYDFEEVVIKNTFELSDFSDTLFANQLADGGFIIADDYDEIMQLRVRNNIDRFNQSYLRLTLLTTLDCNAQCFYCFESKTKQSMPKDVQEAIVAYIATLIPRKQGLHICWMGGEPLLEKDIIFNLSKTILAICEHLNKTYTATIVTNGILLTGDVAEKLAFYGVKEAQVTLDGPKRFHNNIRKTVTNIGTWDNIIENIKNASDFLTIIIRVNLTRENLRHVDELLDEMVSEGIHTKKVYIYFAPVSTCGEGCKNLADSYSSNFITNKEFGNMMIKLYEKLHNRGFKAGINSIRPNKCGAISLDSLTIEPSGTIQKCWSNIGFEHHGCGNIKQGYSLDPNTTKWLNWDVSNLSNNCIRCKILPVCMGNCPYVQMDSSQDDKCSPIKYCMEEYVKLIYLTINEQKSLQ
jgi:uncharacterized protein